MEIGSESSPAEEISASPPSPSPRQSKKAPGGWRAIKYILANETFEKLASMSLVANIAVYLKTKYNMDGVLLINVISIWSGSSNVTSILGAFISDAYLGRFRTLLFGSISSLLGMLFMTLTAGIPQFRPPACSTPPNCTQPQHWQLGLLLMSLTFLALGAGGIRPCNIAFGADQFDTNTKKGRAQLESFFNWWYFTFTIALVVALTTVVYIQTNVSWTLGFAIPAVCLLLSITIFVFGYPTYIIAEPQGSVFVDMAKVITAACRKRKLTFSESLVYDPSLPESSQVTKLTHTDRFKFLDKAALIADESELDNQGFPKNDWRLCSLQRVEELKMLVNMVPIWFSGIGFLMAMDQQSSIGMLQAIQTNKDIGSFRVPPGWMGLSSMIALAIWILIYERIWVPQARKRTGKNQRMTIQQRINMGILLSILTPLAAAAVEKHRRQLALEQDSFESPMSITLLLPQFTLSGLVEAFGAVSLMEFLSTQLPHSMRTVSGAIFFLSLSMASYLNSVLVNITYKATSSHGRTPWLGGQDLNKDKLENFYCFFAGIGMVNILYFNIFACRFLSNEGIIASVKKSDSESKEKEMIDPAR